jgi:hypothetical protein
MHKYIKHPEKRVIPKKELLVKLQNQLSEIALAANSKDFFPLVDDIYKTLEHLDEEPNPALHAMVGGYVKEFVTTFLILYFGSRDLNKSLKAHSLIKALTKYIVLLDKHYDEKSYEHKVHADAIFKKVMSTVDGYVKHAINHGMASLWATASYEIKLRHRMLNGETFTKKEIRNHMLLKSSDTVLYGVILDHYVDSYNPNVLQLLHFNQAILDIQDDLNDLDEDILRRDLNIFVMAASNEIPLEKIYAGKVTTKMILNKSSKMVTEIINDLQRCIVGTNVPPEYGFMKMFSRHYIKTIHESIKK